MSLSCCKFLRYNRGLHTRTSVARLPLRQLGFLVIVCLQTFSANLYWRGQTPCKSGLTINRSGFRREFSEAWPPRQGTRCIYYRRQAAHCSSCKVTLTCSGTVPDVHRDWCDAVVIATGIRVAGLHTGSSSNYTSLSPINSTHLTTVTARYHLWRCFGCNRCRLLNCLRT